MKTTLQNKTAIVTGSTSGIGQEIAKTLAAAGCNVMLNGFATAQEVEALKYEMRLTCQMEASYHGADMTKPREIADLVDTTIRHYGGVDILVNNAGAQFVAPLEEFPDEKWDALIALNLSAAFHTTKAVLGSMRSRQWGRIINIASAHGLVASPYKAAYVAAKHGLVGLTKVTALETARDGITCNAICPGFIKTAVVDRQIRQQAEVSGIPESKVIDELILPKHPTREFVKVEQVAALALFLCLDASASITGSALPMDGGWTAV